MQLSGATVVYKTRLQPTVDMSLPEAEFMAASDAGKISLFVRSILYTTLTFHKKPLPSSTRIMMAQSEWQTRKTQLVLPATWTLDMLLLQIGWKEI